MTNEERQEFLNFNSDYICLFEEKKLKSKMKMSVHDMIINWKQAIKDESYH